MADNLFGNRQLHETALLYDISWQQNHETVFGFSFRFQENDGIFKSDQACDVRNKFVVHLKCSLCFS